METESREFGGRRTTRIARKAQSKPGFDLENLVLETLMDRPLSSTSRTTKGTEAIVYVRLSKGEGVGKCQGQFRVLWDLYLLTSLVELSWVAEVLVFKSLDIWLRWTANPMKSCTLTDLLALSNP